MHHRGTARGKVRRQVIPASSRIPDPMAVKIRDVLVAHFEAAVSNG
jgi:hypothetical protein